jgi:polyhydroxybutyrate depolymerase
MHRRLVTLFAALGLACAHAPEPAEAAGLKQASLQSGGRTRTFSYLVPAGKEGQRLPLVVGLHGRLGDGKGQDKLGGMSAVAEKEGFVLALPDGYRRSWHDARDKGPAAEEGIDDVAFLSALIDWFIAHQNVDASRVYVMGMSNGGFMTLTLACALADKVAAVASVTGTVSENLKPKCAPSRAIPVALFLGDSDPLVPYAGGEVANGRNGRAISAADSAALFAQLDGCTGAPQSSTLADIDPADGTRIELEVWNQCRAGSEVRLYTVKGGGHTWPGGWGYLSESFIGATSRDLSATAEAWAFFQRFSLAPKQTQFDSRVNSSRRLAAQASSVEPAMEGTWSP